MFAAMMARQQSGGTRHSCDETAFQFTSLGTNSQVYIKQTHSKTESLEIKRSTSDLPPNIATHVAKYSSQVAADIFSQMLNSSSPLVSTLPVPEIAMYQLRDAAKRLPENTDARALSYLLQNNWLSGKTPEYFSTTDHTMEPNIYEEGCPSIMQFLTTPNPIVPLCTGKSSPTTLPTRRLESTGFNGAHESSHCPSSVDLPVANCCEILNGADPQYNPASDLFLLDNAERPAQDPLCASQGSVKSLSVASYADAPESPRAAVIATMSPEPEHRELINTRSVVPIADHTSINASNSLIPNRIAGLGGDSDFLPRSGDERMKRECSNNQIRPAFSQREPSAYRCARRNARDGDGETELPPAKKAKGPQGRAMPVRGGVDGERDGGDNNGNGIKVMTDDRKRKNFLDRNRYVFH
ncbi:hypothetical protein HOY82DRAFT_646825 [Tuber indicum]|nr:hypothetical protein HOY82DRAFT_646825 [Tuber indicum]